MKFEFHHDEILHRYEKNPTRSHLVKFFSEANVEGTVIEFKAKLINTELYLYNMRIK